MGGSTLINGLTYGRGSSSIYDLWQEMGNEGWNWDSVLPYFERVSQLVCTKHAATDNLSRARPSFPSTSLPSKHTTQVDTPPTARSSCHIPHMYMNLPRPFSKA